MDARRWQCVGMELRILFCLPLLPLAVHIFQGVWLCPPIPQILDRVLGLRDLTAERPGDHGDRVVMRQ